MIQKKSRTIRPNPNSTAKSSGEIRIIGGKWRGRKLPVIDSIGLRPTTDRIKETLFNWLMPYILDAHCLDCYAGSGSLGFEAISRGAATATLVEQSKPIALQLEKNRATLKADNISIINSNVLERLSHPADSAFDLVFIDPPFNQNLVQTTIDKLVSNQWLSPQAWIYIETETSHAPLILPNSWLLHREKQAGQVSYRLYFQDNE